MKIFLTAILFLFSFCVQAQIEKSIPKKPSPPRLVNDYTNTLTPAQVQALEDKLVAYDDSTSSQVTIVIVNSLDGYDVADYALTLGREWGVGGKEHSNGIIILIAKDDHKIRIEVGYGLEGAIPDITAKSIIDNSITPHFKEDNYYRGLDQGTDDIIKAAAGEYKAPSDYGSKKKKGIPISTIIFIVIILIAIFSGAGPGSGAAITRGGLLGGLIGGGSGWSGGGGSSGGGGGFGGFGGGSFGGGGASGSW